MQVCRIRSSMIHKATRCRMDQKMIEGLGTCFFEPGGYILRFPLLQHDGGLMIVRRCYREERFVVVVFAIEVTSERFILVVKTLLVHVEPYIPSYALYLHTCPNISSSITFCYYWDYYTITTLFTSKYAEIRQSSYSKMREEQSFHGMGRGGTDPTQRLPAKS